LIKGNNYLAGTELGTNATVNVNGGDLSSNEGYTQTISQSLTVGPMTR